LWSESLSFTSTRTDLKVGHYKNSRKTRTLKTAGSGTQANPPHKNKKPTWPVVWHVGFEAWTTKTLSSEAPQARSGLPTATAAGRVTTTDLARVPHI